MVPPSPPVVGSCCGRRRRCQVRRPYELGRTRRIIDGISRRGRAPLDGQALEPAREEDALALGHPVGPAPQPGQPLEEQRERDPRARAERAAPRCRSGCPSRRRRGARGRCGAGRSGRRRRTGARRGSPRRSAPSRAPRPAARRLRARRRGSSCGTAPARATPGAAPPRSGPAAGSGASRRAPTCSGWSNSSASALPIARVTVTWPATTRSSGTPITSTMVSGSSLASRASRSALIRSSPGLARPLLERLVEVALQRDDAVRQLDLALDRLDRLEERQPVVAPVVELREVALAAAPGGRR